MFSKTVYMIGPYDLKLKEVEIPQIKGEQAIVKLKACGICGSDVECYKGRSKEGRYDIAPYVPGHEWSGEIVEVGKEVKFLKKGDRVTGDCVLPCGKCDNCKAGLPPASCKNMREVGFRPDSPGGMAEYLVLEEQFLHKLPEDMTYEEGALIEPFSVSYFGIWGDGGYVDASDDVVIFGAGPIGLFALVVAKVAGARVIVIEPLEYRRKMAKKLGADELIDPKVCDIKEAIMEITKGQGADVAVEASGNDTAIASLFDVTKGNARVRLIGHSIGRKVPVEIGLTIWKGLFIHGLAGTKQFFPRTIRFMTRAKERIDYSQIITHRFPLEKIKSAFSLATDKKTEVIKIMLVI